MEKINIFSEDITVKNWTIRSIEDLYKSIETLTNINKLLNKTLKEQEQRIIFLENKLMNKEEKEYIEKHGEGGLTYYEASLLEKSFKENDKLYKKLSKL